MASASSAIKLCVLVCRRVTRLRTPPSYTQQRSQRLASSPWVFTTSTARRADQGAESPEQEGDEDGKSSKSEPKMMSKMLRERMTIEKMQTFDEIAKTSGHNTIDDLLQETLEDHKVAAEDRELSEQLFKDDIGSFPNKTSFWYDEEDPETNTEEHDTFDEDDITSMAHGKLDEVREMRHYARLTVWEMPLLAKLAKPFVPPSDTQVLRWRYTTYFGESHPAERKVVVEFAPDDLKLTAVQTNKLKKLAGPRYSPETELIKMSCESFEHQAQNKRYLLELVDKLVTEAKDPADTFEDVPLDLRHHRFKTKPRFPREWRLTKERQQQLAEHWQGQLQADMQRSEKDALVDGRRILEEQLAQIAAKEQEALAKEAAMAAASQYPRSLGRTRW